MSLSHSLSNALSGMTAATRLAEIVSSNVANSMTDGYGRRVLNLSSASVGGRGAGVEIGGVTRLVDRGVLAERRLSDAEMADVGARSKTWSQLEFAFGRVGDAASLASRITALEDALVDAAADPASDIRLGVVKNRLSDVAAAFNSASDSIQGMRAEADADIATQVDELNTALVQVERLNADITRARNTGNDPSSLIDQRQLVIDRIAEIVPVRELDRQGGQVALMTPTGETLIDGPAKRFGFAPTPMITPDMTLGGGGLSGLTLDGAPYASDGVGKLTGGSLGAAFAARDEILVDAQGGLDLLASDLVTRLQDPAVDSTLAVGDPGLLTDGGGAFDTLNTEGLSARLTVNAAIDPSQGGALWKIRDGLNAPVSGAIGDAGLLLSISDALATPTTATGGSAQSLAGHTADFLSGIGSSRLEAESELGFANARWATLKEAEAAGGVDTDYEMQMLLRVEQAYAANARLVQTVEDMLSRLMEL